MIWTVSQKKFDEIWQETYMKTETCKLYSRILWYFCQISSKL